MSETVKVYSVGVFCGNCNYSSEELVVPAGTKVSDTKCPGCGCKGLLWPVRKEASGLGR